MAKKRIWTAADIGKLTLAEYEKNRAEIMAALKEGRIKGRLTGTNASSVRVGDQ